jgi:hypothetical protein
MNAEARRAALVVGPLLLAVATAGCVIPVPVAAVYGDISEASIAAIKPGVSTRADVVLLLADPTTRGEQDGHFIYSWHRLHGAAIVAFPYPLAAGSGQSCHCLVVRFAPNGYVTARRVFDGAVHLGGATILDSGADRPDICTRDQELRQRIREWLNEASPSGG